MDTNTIPESLRKEFLEVVAHGDEQAARDFLITNIKGFPRAVQDEIIGAFFEEALLARSAGLHAVADFQKQGLAAIDALEKGKQQLEDKKKLLDIKGGI